MTTYKEAGVNIDAGEETVNRIKTLVRRTFTPAVLTDIGAFGGFYRFDKDAYREPVLVSSVDGVGTKLIVAFMAGRHDTVGQDLVNHCVNDIAVCGAMPLFFLDYFATGKLDPDIAEQVVRGFAKGCEENRCALIGGETAEMPDLYKAGEYDLSGTVVGVVEKSRLLTGDRVKAGDVVLALPSNGLHTNGYSLARKVLFSRFELDDRPQELLGWSIAEELLRVHRSYLGPIQRLFEKDLVHAVAHITGGGIEANTSRVVTTNRVVIDWESWERPPIFQLIQEIGDVPEKDMRRALNLGVGLTIIVDRADEDEVSEVLSAAQETPMRIGHITISS